MERSQFLLPIFWLIPWTISKALFHNYWCWQTECDINLILKIPNSILLIFNICCACFIIRTLYSKMRSRVLSLEKIMKYRRLAKSILILIPIFGLHFIFFAWLPYANLIQLDLGDCLEIIYMYIETFFNAFQGLVVSITTCFISKEVRIEFVLFFCETVRKIKCLRSIRCISKCVESDYVRQLRFSYYENRSTSVFNNGASVANTPLRRPLSTPANLAVLKNYTDDNNETEVIPDKNKINKMNNNSLNPKLSTISANTSIASSSSKRTCCFNLLLGTEHNDFYYQTHPTNKFGIKKKQKILNEPKFDDFQNKLSNDDIIARNLNGKNKNLNQKENLNNDIILKKLVIHESENLIIDQINQNQKKINNQNYGEAQNLKIKS